MQTLKTREDILKLLPKNIKIAELGIFKGEFSELIMKNVQPNEFFLVDLFSGNIASGDKDGNNISFANMGNVFIDLQDKYINIASVKIVKNFSHVFLESLEDNYLDAVYIDAEHSYSAVKRELELSRKKIKNNGFIMGHDYQKGVWDGVILAVDEFCKMYNLQINYLTEDNAPSFLIINKK
jgi:hypothetical protein